MKRLLIIVTGIVFLIFLYWHWRLGIVRYFDVDEFAYLHWARLVSLGQRPYVDFFFYIPPGFLWFLAPLFWLGGRIWPVIIARALSWGVFATLGVAIGVLFYRLRAEKKEWWLVLLPGVILSFLPLPFDKLLEIRPDTLAILLVFLGMIVQTRSTKLFYAGLWYGLSIIVLPKSVPLVAVAAAVAYFSSRKQFVQLVSGLAVPLGIVGAWLITLGSWDTVWNSLTRLPFETSKIAQTFVMQPDLFFYPNSTYYGGAGWSRELIVNHMVWIIGLGLGIYRLFTASKERLVSGMFLVSIVSFMYLYPLRHAQYLIPIAAFVSFYAADAVFLVWQRMRKNKTGERMFFVGFIVLLFFLLQVFLSANKPKLAWDNKQMQVDMGKIWDIIPKDAYVLDLDGRTLYFLDPYYVCCLPFGQYEPYLSRPLPSLEEALERTNTQYIYEGQLARVQTLSQEDQTYINAHFRADPRVPGLLIRKPTSLR
jgi:hypothetical protein